MKTGSAHSYRPDIDGLRAIAVLSVFIFHLSESALPGGFVGVDIFFVISGFLISSHLISSIESQTFSLSDFYLRRIKRILPALFTVVLFSFVLGLLLLLPSNLEKMAQSAMAALAFVANYFFAADYDYFSPRTTEIPLLHLWSLSVEEQFYIFFPVLLFVAFKKLSRRLLIVFLTICLGISMAWAEYSIASVSLQKFAFYGIPSRAGEFLVGSLLSLCSIRIRRSQAEWLAAVGFIGLMSCFFFINSFTRFPGLVSLLPCGFTAMIIFANASPRSGQATYIARLLSLRAVVFVGLISYSLYLYHWPLMAFVRYSTLRTHFTLVEGVGITFFSFLLATLSLYFVERPFRHARGGSKISIVTKYFLLPSATLLILSWLMVKNQGVPSRFDAKSNLQSTLHYLDETFCHDKDLDQKCVFGDLSQAPQVLLIGDSHAGHYQPLLDELGKNLGFSFVARSVDTCWPLVIEHSDFFEKVKDQSCKDQMIWAQQNAANFQTVIFAGKWSYYREQPEAAEYLKNLTASVKALRAKNKKVIFLSQVPRCEGVLPLYRTQFSVLRYFSNEDSLKKNILESCDQLEEENKEIEEFAKSSGALYWPITKAFQESRGSLPFSGDHYLYKDNDHLNQAGSVEIGKWLSANPGHARYF